MAKIMLLHDDGSHEEVDFMRLKKGDLFIIVDSDGKIMEGRDGFVRKATIDAEVHSCPDGRINFITVEFV